MKVILKLVKPKLVGLMIKEKNLKEALILRKLNELTL